MDGTVKLIIEIPEKTIAHIRSDYGHGYKGLYDEDRDKIVDAIYHGTPLDSVRADVINIADGRQSIKVRSVLRILDRIGKGSEE